MTGWIISLVVLVVGKCARDSHLTFFMSIYASHHFLNITQPYVLV